MILEYGINEVGYGTWSEILVRLLLRKGVAIIFLETFSLSGRGPYGKLHSQMKHVHLARYYDIPLLSGRDALSDLAKRVPSTMDVWFAQDRHHPSCEGHEFLGYLCSELIRHVNMLSARTERQKSSNNDRNIMITNTTTMPSCRTIYIQVLSQAVSWPMQA